MEVKVFRSHPIKLSDSAFYADNQVPQTVQILRVGSFFHDGQKVQITEPILESMVKNFSEKVRGVDLMIDYRHDSEGEAAAWIEELYLSEDKQELWARVRWTDDGQDSIIKKKYRYISADFNFNYKNNETLAEYGPTLYGAALTNRPVVKNMKPVIQLSEQNKETNMNEEELKKRIVELEGIIAELKGKKNDGDVALEAKDKEMEEMKKEFSEKEEKHKEEKAKLEKESAFNKLFAEGKVVEAQRESFISGDMVKFSELAQPIKTDNEGTKIENKDESTTDAESKILELAEKEMKEKNVSLSEGIQNVLRRDKKLHDEYKKKFI